MISKSERICENCNTTFFVRTAELRGNPKRYGRFCCRSCAHQYRSVNNPTLTCSHCGKTFSRPPVAASGSGKNKSTRNFCNHSCAATYNNTHKTYGSRRSKLEAYLEAQLRSEFPDLELICNGKETIGSELDFYFPQLRLAIELNGIFHYEPIYGADKLERTQRNDQQKYTNCLAVGIELCIIDASSVVKLTKSAKERYWTIVQTLVVPLLERNQSHQAQIT